MEKVKESKGIALVAMIIIIVVIAAIMVGTGIFVFMAINKENTSENSMSANDYKTEAYEDNTEENETINQEDSEEDMDTENDSGEISWNAMFPGGGNKTTITFREDREIRAFKMDFPENYELNPWQRDYEGQTVKKLIEETGDIQNNVWTEGEDAGLWAYIETSQTSEKETFTQRAQRKYPDGFALGTEEHPAWVDSDSGTINLYYQGGQNYALVIRYDNTSSIYKFGEQAVAEYLYNMITYTEN